MPLINANDYPICGCINKMFILSICIPTFNRSTYLDILLKTLETIVLTHGEDVEVCISDNHSTDDTADIINKYRTKFALKATTQLENIGGTRNFIAVSAMATGKWIMLIGDDDDLNLENFAKLMALLRYSNESDWVLVGVEDDSNKEILIGNMLAKRYDAKSFRTVVLHTGLYRYGFIGMHVFPAKVQPMLQDIACKQEVIEKRQPWPHIYLFLQYIQWGHIQVFPPAVVKQGPNGSQLFWNIGDWVCVNLIKLNNIALVRNTVSDHRWFFNALLLRELYSLRNIKEIMLWKLLEPVTFSKRAFFEVYSRYQLLGLLIFLAMPHALLILILLITPNYIFRNSVSKRKIHDYLAKNEKMDELCAMKRGI